MDTRRSCCSSSVCCGMPVEKGCFIFAIINAVICSLATIAGLVFLIVMLCTSLVGLPDPKYMVLVYLFSGIIAAGPLGSVIALTFSVILCVGVSKNKKRFVLAYLIYGIIAVILSVLVTIGFLWMQWGEKELMLYALIPLGVCVIYSGLLVLVYQTYVVFSESERTPMAGHKSLLNTYEF